MDAIDKVVVTARIQGFLKTIEAEKNDPVTKGQLLATIDAEDFESQLAGARADAAASEQAVVEMRASLESLRAFADKARIEYDRKRALINEKVGAMVGGRLGGVLVLRRDPLENEQTGGFLGVDREIL